MKFLWVLAVLIAAWVLVPVVAIFFGWFSFNSELWRHFYNYQLIDWLKNTFMLVSLVGIFVTLLGVSLAWLFVHYEFTGRKWLEWAVVLPMTIPSYVLAFIFLGVWDFAGPVQTFLRSYDLTWLLINDIRNIWTLSLVMSFCLYPYSYLLAREAFLSQSANLNDAAKTLGANTFKANFFVRLGMAKTAIFAGTAMAMMETLADFGTVSIFNIDTFTVAIYKAWFDFFDINMACQLASILLIIVFAALLMQSGKNRLANRRTEIQRKARVKLHGYKQALAFVLPLGLCLMVFVIPLLQLVYWIAQSLKDNGFSGYGVLLNNSLILGTVSTILILIAALLLVIIERFSQSSVSRKIIPVVRLGYALPGSVLAVGLIMSLGQLEQIMTPIKKLLGFDAGQLFIGGIFILCLSYLIRFANVAIGPLSSAYEGISNQLIEVTNLSTPSKIKAFFQVQLPLLKTGLLTAAVLVFVDILKEMPATLLLRPFGWDTLAVRVFEMTSEGEYEMAALPALTIVLIGFIPVILTIAHSRTRLATIK